jgi:putative glutamine amidotransferase
MGNRVAVTFGEPSKLPPYLEALRSVGLRSVSSPASLDGLAGLLLTGGADIGADTNRDKLEFRLLKEAIQDDLPVFAICRGLQLLNVALGGTLIQDIPKHRKPGLPEVHPVAIAPGTRLAAILGAGPYQVNSRHHQAADHVAPGLVVSAKAPDGIIEGLEHPEKRFLLAVQWHPEDRIATHGGDRKLFEAFAQAVMHPE